MSFDIFLPIRPLYDKRNMVQSDGREEASTCESKSSKFLFNITSSSKIRAISQLSSSKQ